LQSQLNGNAGLLARLQIALHGWRVKVDQTLGMSAQSSLIVKVVGIQVVINKVTH
jgi:hypothetical protein